LITIRYEFDYKLQCEVCK